MRYFRRFRMEFCFAERTLPDPVLPAGYEFVPWDPRDIDRHARAKYLSFHSELDALVFPCLSRLETCRRLMLEIAGQRTFLPEATWLLCYRSDERQLTPLDCGTIQGLANGRDAGSIQNVGVVPEHRGQGLGRALVLQALRGFQQRGLKRVYLEATAENTPAIELYRTIGFRLIRTSYREVADPPPDV